MTSTRPSKKWSSPTRDYNSKARCHPNAAGTHSTTTGPSRLPKPPKNSQNSSPAGSTKPFRRHLEWLTISSSPKSSATPCLAYTSVKLSYPTSSTATQKPTTSQDKAHATTKSSSRFPAKWGQHANCHGATPTARSSPTTSSKVKQKSCSTPS